MFGYYDHDEKDCKGEPCPLHGSPYSYFLRTIGILIFIGFIIYLFGVIKCAVV